MVMNFLIELSTVIASYFFKIEAQSNEKCTNSMLTHSILILFSCETINVICLSEFTHFFQYITKLCIELEWKTIDNYMTKLAAFLGMLWSRKGVPSVSLQGGWAEFTHCKMRIIPKLNNLVKPLVTRH